MPQMAPYNWIMLNIYFISMIILLMTIIYYTPIKNYFKKKNYIKNIYKYKW